MSVSSKTCPKCGAAIPPEAPQGLCPKCLLREVSIATDTGKPAPSKADLPSREQLAAAFPHLEIIELIGQGGMGLVYKARQPKLDRFVALKILPQSLASDPNFTERFTREGRVLAKLSHPNIVTVHDFGQANSFFYLLMEFVNGVNLRQAMQAGRFTAAQALGLVPDICEALQYAHTQGILHRDIKPENILLDTNGRIKIVDFGIAKLVGEVKPRSVITSGGVAIGTPHYMAPEQIEKPAEVDHRADIYSLGVVLYELLTGELPLGRFPPPSEKTAVNPGVDVVVLRALEKEREKRYQSAREVKTQVEGLGDPTRAVSGAAHSRAVKRPVWRMIVIGIVAAFGIIGLVWSVLSLVYMSRRRVTPAALPVRSKTVQLYNSTNRPSAPPVMRFEDGRMKFVHPEGAKANYFAVETGVTLSPEERLRPTVHFADGRVGQGGIHEITRRVAGEKHSIYIFSWTLPDSVAEHELEAAASRFRELEHGSLTLTENEPKTLIGTTNMLGQEIQVCLEYAIERPPTDSAVTASLRVTGTNIQTSYMQKPYSGMVSATFDTTVPAAHVVDCIGLTVNGLFEENTRISNARSGTFKSFECEWTFPGRFSTNDFLEAARQLAGAVFVIKPRERKNAFSVTNEAGDVMRGYLELVAPQ